MPLLTSSPPSKARPSLAFLFLPLALSLGSCSLFFTEGDPYASQPKEDPRDFVGPQSFEEEFPFVRINDLGGGRYRAVMTAPVGSGIAIRDVLLSQVPFLADAAAPPAADSPEAAGKTATIRVMEKGGKVFNAKADGAQMPWSGPGTFADVEDLLVLEGDELDLRELFRMIDVWYNGGPQIEISAVVLETINSDSFERGVTQVSQEPIFRDADGAAFLRAIGGSFPTSGNPTLTGGGVGGVAQVGLLDSSFLVDAAIQLLQDESLVDVVSQPSIVTRNGVPANVESTEQIPFLNVSSFNISGGATFSIATKEVGVKLKVTPFLVGTDTIHLVIFAEVSRLGQDFVVGTDGNNQPISSPSLNKRSATTEVYVRNGQTVAIGGLQLKEGRVSESKVPFLGDLPLLGWLFSSRQTEDVETKVTFLITPKLKKRPSIDPIGEYFDPTAEAAESEE